MVFLPVAVRKQPRLTVRTVPRRRFPGGVARFASLGDHDSTTVTETVSLMLALKPYLISEAVHEGYKIGDTGLPVNDLAMLEFAEPLLFSEDRSVRPSGGPDLKCPSMCFKV